MHYFSLFIVQKYWKENAFQHKEKEKNIDVKQKSSLQKRQDFCNFVVLFKILLF